jgi:hypothetical protein
MAQPRSSADLFAGQALVDRLLDRLALRHRLIDAIGDAEATLEAIRRIILCKGKGTAHEHQRCGND